ncbi:MAG: hypothetical protein GXX96_13305 [Planctomycetaceae bacterium]|nr:hypothetical protein [Planctomycetaceae bacterium]
MKGWGVLSNHWHFVVWSRGDGDLPGEVCLFGCAVLAVIGMVKHSCRSSVCGAQG